MFTDLAKLKINMITYAVLIYISYLALCWNSTTGSTILLYVFKYIENKNNEELLFGYFYPLKTN